MAKQWPQMIGIGSSVYDTLMMVPRFPEEDTKLEGLETKVQGGGPCATALVAARKLGVSSAYMGTIGDDPFGRYMLEDLEHWGVDTDYVRRVPGVVSFHAVVFLNTQRNTRTCIWNRGTVPQPLREDVNKEALSHAKVLHLDGHMLEAAIAAAKLCHTYGVKVSQDAGGTYPGVEELLPYVDWLIPSEEFALRMTGEESPEAAAHRLYERYRPELLVVTQGVRGGLLLDHEGLRRYESYRVDARDTNGCGDTFHGAFVAAKIKGMNNDSGLAAMQAPRRQLNVRGWERGRRCPMTQSAGRFSPGEASRCKRRLKAKAERREPDGTQSVYVRHDSHRAGRCRWS